MSGNIRLHKEKGLNPRMTFCPGCGSHTDEIMLVGERNFVETCLSCGASHYGGADDNSCKRCGNIGFDRRELQDSERVPGFELCRDCKEKREEIEKAIGEGAVFFMCGKCGNEGLVNGDSAFAIAVRKEAKQPTGPIGVKVPVCPNCSGEE